jgi:acyl-coenzyme A thioesterase PaaI-like protein
MRSLPHTHSCFVCGESNPKGLQLRFETDGRIVRGRFKPCAEHVGFRGVVHGGILATVLDEVMVWACAVQTRKFGFCAELTVRFSRPVHPEDEALVTAELVADRRGKLMEACAEMHDGKDLLLASATGKYIPIKDADLETMARDFVGGPPWPDTPREN